MIFNSTCTCTNSGIYSESEVAHFYSVVITLCDGPGCGLVSTQTSVHIDPPPNLAEEETLSVGYLEIIG